MNLWISAQGWPAGARGWPADFLADGGGGSGAKGRENGCPRAQFFIFLMYIAIAGA